MPNIHINTTHTITCENAPVEEVYAELQEKCPDVTGRPDLELKNGRLKRDNDFAMHRIGELQDTVAARNRERDELQKRLEDSWAVKEKLIAENADLTSELDKANEEYKAAREEVSEWALKAANLRAELDKSRPALPEGMRIAEHTEYGRVVVSPETNANGYYMFFTSVDSTASKAAYWYAKPSELTFLVEEPAPEPLPKPEDCKSGDWYKIDVGGYHYIAQRSGDDAEYPWEDLYDNWRDSDVTLLARLTPDRNCKEQA